MNRAQPYQHGFAEAKAAAIKVIDDRIAELKASPLAELESQGIVMLMDIRNRIQSMVK